MPRKLEKLITLSAIIFMVIGLPAYLWAQGDVVIVTPIESFVTDLLTMFVGQFSLGGWSIAVGLLGCLVMFSIRAVRLFKPLWWDKLTPLAKFLLPFFAAALGAFVIGVAGALAAKIALGTVAAKLVGAAIGAGFAAVTVNEGSKSAGESFDTMMLKKDPNYIPGTLRKKMSMVVGIPDLNKLKKKIGIVE